MKIVTKETNDAQNDEIVNLIKQLGQEKFDEMIKKTNVVDTTTLDEDLDESGGKYFVSEFYNPLLHSCMRCLFRHNGQTYNACKWFVER